MKDPKRIQEILDLIYEIWQRSPELRFNQLIYNLQFDYSQKNGGIGQVKKTSSDGFEQVGFDFFNLDDSAFIEYLRTKSLINE